MKRTESIAASALFTEVLPKLPVTPILMRSRSASRARRVLLSYRRLFSLSPAFIAASVQEKRMGYTADSPKNRGYLRYSSVPLPFTSARAAVTAPAETSAPAVIALSALGVYLSGFLRLGA